MAQITLREIPLPSLENADPAIERQTSEILAEIEALGPPGSGNAADLASTYGRLGQVYLLYRLYDAAEPAFRNAAYLAPEDLRWSYYLATVLQQTNQLEESIVLLEAIHEALPGDVATTIRLGRAEFARGDRERARRWWEVALALDPSAAAAHAGLGEIASVEEDWPAAIRHFEAALKSQPSADRLHHQLGLAYRGAGDLEAARRHLQLRGSGIVQFPDPLINELVGTAPSASFYVSRGLRAQSRGDLTGAIALYRKALDLDGDNLRARRSLLAAAAKQGSLDVALEQASWLLERDPDDVVARYNAGLVLALKDDLAAARDYFQGVVERNPDFKSAHVNLAGVYRAMGQPEEAEQHYTRAIELDPYNLQTRLDRSLNRAESGQFAAARDDLEVVLEQDPENAHARIAYGRVLLATGQRDAGLAQLGRALEMELTTVQRGAAEFEMGRVRLAAGEPALAIPHLERAAAALPDDAEVHAELARALGQQQRFRDAAKSYARLLEIDPDRESAWFGRAIALLLAEQYPEASDHLHSAVTKWPDALPLRHLLARFLATSPEATLRDGRRALELARDLASREQTLDHGRTLAMALAETGAFSEAQRIVGILADQARATGNQSFLGVLESDLARYEANQPLRAPWLGPR